MKMKHGAILASVAIASTVALAGCSAATSSPVAAAKSLTVWDYYTYNPVEGSVTALLNECGAAAGVTIHHQSIPDAQYDTKVLQAASSKSLPGLLMLDNPDVPRFANTGALADLGKLGLNTTGAVKSAAALGVYKNTLYGIVPAVTTLALYYNKAQFAKAGLTPPTTWTQLKSDALKLKSGARYGFAFSALNDGEGTYSYLPFYVSAGGTLNAATDVASTAGVKSLTYLAGLVKDGAASQASLNWGLSDVQTQFTSQDASMVITGSWAFSQFDSAKISWGTVPIPVPAEGDVSRQVLGGEAWTIPTASTATETAAAKVLKCLTTEKNELKFGTQNGRLPANSTALSAYLKANPNMQAFEAPVADSITRAGVLGPKWADVDTALGVALQSAIAGKSTPKAALTVAAATK